jgi:hypothetical protein
MSTFMEVHSGFVGVTAPAAQGSARASLGDREDAGVHFERDRLDLELGKVFCLSSTPTKPAVMRVHERTGHPTAEVYELTVEVRPRQRDLAQQGSDAATETGRP